MSAKSNSIGALNRVSVFAFLIAGGIFSSESYASCVLQPTLEAYSVNFGNVRVQRDAPIGSTIASRVMIRLGNVGNCTVATNYQTVLGIFSVPSGIAGTYNTNIPGIGIRPTTNASVAVPGVRNLPAGITLGPVDHIFDLIKTGPTGAGALTLGTVTRSAYQNLRWIADFNLTGTTVQTLACSVTTTNIVVPMGTVKRALFTGVGTPVAERNFEVPLDCDNRTIINITINGVADGSGVAGVLALDAGTGTATGIGLQVLHSGVPIKLGTRLPIGTATSDGGYRVSLTARYLQNAPTVTAGQANSTATFTMTYN